MREHDENAHQDKAHQEEVFDLDVNVKVVVKTGVWLFGTIVVSMVLMWFLIVFLKNQQIKADPPASPLEVRQRVMPPGERLQPSPFEGMDAETPERQLDAFLARQQAVLGSAAWISKETGLARIPIEDAIKHIATHGLPATAPTVETVHFPPVEPAAAGH